MQRGVELEFEARAFFTLETGLSVDQVGFITNDAGSAGCSPDGLIAETAGLEIKCPKASTHFKYLRAGDLPAFYKPQVHFSMAITGFTQWWFMSYFPGLDPLILTVERDDYTAAIESALATFLEKLAEQAQRFGL